MRQSEVRVSNQSHGTIVASIADDFGFDSPDLNDERLRKQTLRVLHDLREEIDRISDGVQRGLRHRL